MQNIAKVQQNRFLLRALVLHEQFDTFEYLTYDNIVLFIAFSRAPFSQDNLILHQLKLGQKLQI